MKVWDVQLNKESNKTMDVEESHTHKGYLKGHTASINSISIQPERNLILSSSDDKTIRLWDFNTNVCIRKMTTTNDESTQAIIKSCTFLPSSTSFVVADDDGVVSQWDSRTGKIANIITKHTKTATTVSVSQDGQTLVSGGWDNVVQICDLRTTSTISCSGHSDWVLTTAISRNGQHILSAGWDPVIYSWARGYMKSTYEGHTDTMTTLDISNDGNYFASGSYDSSIILWDLRKRNAERSFAGHKGRINEVIFSPEPYNLLISAGSDMTVKLWEKSTGHLSGEFFSQGPTTTVDAAIVNNYLTMVFGDSIGNLYLSKLHKPRKY